MLFVVVLAGVGCSPVVAQALEVAALRVGGRLSRQWRRRIWLTQWLPPACDRWPVLLVPCSWQSHDPMIALGPGEPLSHSGQDSSFRLSVGSPKIFIDLRRQFSVRLEILAYMQPKSRLIRSIPIFFAQKILDIRGSFYCFVPLHVFLLRVLFH